MTEPQQQGNVPNQSAEQNSGAQQPQAQPQVAPQPQIDNSASSRTQEQFEKLLESNRQLFAANQKLQDEMASRVQTPEVPVHQERPNNQPQQVDPRDFIERDPVTGEQYIDEAKMRKRIQEIEERAQRAETAINSYIKTAEQRDQERQTMEAFSSYPELDPGNPKFNEGFHRQVRGVLTDSMFNAQDYGRVLSFKEAADFVRGQQLPAQVSNPEKGNENLVPESAASPGNAKKEQGAAQAVSEPQNAPAQVNSEELEHLRYQTRMGSDEALAMRLISTEHTRSE